LPPEAIRRARRAYFGACSYIDANIGKLMKTLTDCGLRDDTIVVFSGDHGDMLGERGLWYKMHWFEASARVPMVISAPGRIRHGRVAQSVSTIDLLPTFVSMAGGQPVAGLAIDGRSLMPHLTRGEGHDEVIGEYMAEGSRETVVMIRRGRYKFIHAAQDPDLLFDVQADPRELNNLAQTPEHRECVAAFRAEVARRWDLPSLNARVLDSQRRRRLVYESLRLGRLASWDHQPIVDASQQYMRNHIDLDDLERRARFPVP
jgi:choline-sulfatase